MTGWRDSAACRDSDPQLFFPAGKGGGPVAQVKAARAVCARCPVRIPCLEFAVEGGDRHGVFGGLSERQRRPLLAARAREAAA